MLGGGGVGLTWGLMFQCESEAGGQVRGALKGGKWGGSPVNTGSMLDSCRCDGLSIDPASLGVREENSHCSSARMAPGGRHPAVAESGQGSWRGIPMLLLRNMS